MQFKYCFTLTVILIVLFSLTAVVAGENVTDDSSLDDTLASDVFDAGIEDNQNTVKSSNEVNDNGIDLYVKDNGYKTEIYNYTDVINLPCTIFASVDGGVAHNAKVQLYYTVDDFFEFSSYNLTMGTFNQTTGIWNIGDLSSGDNASLTLFIKFKPKGNFTGGAFILISYATTDSYDINVANNFLVSFFNISSSSSHVAESGNKDDAQHNNYENSNPSSYSVVVLIEDSPSEDSSDQLPGESNPQLNEKTDSNSNNGESSNSNLYVVLKEINQNSLQKTINLVNVFSKAPDALNIAIYNSHSITPDSIGSVISNSFSRASDSIGGVISNVLSITPGSLGNAISNIFNLDANDESFGSSSMGGAVHAYDYTKIPIMIFLLFLVILVGMVGYDKVKS